MQPRLFEIDAIDPLVGDSACHTRAVYQADLANKETLSEQETTYLQYAALLTKVRQVERDEFDIIIDERMDMSEVKLNKMSNGELAKRKKLVAEDAVTFFEKNCENLKRVDIKKLDKRIMKASKTEIPVLSLYLSAKMMLYACSTNNIPLFVYLKRIKSEGGQYKLDSSCVLTYDYSKKTSSFVPVKMPEDKTGVAIEMVSCTVDEVKTLDDFVVQLTEQDIATLIMIMAAGHDQYPKLIKTEDKLRESNDVLKELPAQSEFKVDLRVASAAEYNQLCKVAFKYGMFRDTARYAFLDKEAKTKMRTTTSIAYIDHTYSATLGKVNEKNKILLRKCEGLVVQKEISGGLK